MRLDVHRTILTIAVAAALAVSPELRGQTGELDDAFASAVTYRQGESRAALTVIERAALASWRDVAAQRDLEACLVALLENEAATREARSFACRQLAIAGTDASIPALAVALRDPDLSHMARYALQVMPGDAAGAALQAALDDVDDELGRAILNSIRARRGMRQPVMTRVGEVGSPHRALETARLLGPTSSDAISIYRTLYEAPSELPRQVRYAALAGWVERDSVGSVDAVLDRLADGDPFWSGSAARLIREAPGPATSMTYADRLAGLPPLEQIRLMDALADRGKTIASDAAAGAAGELLGAPDAGVRDAAARTVGRLGGSSYVAILVNAATAGNNAAGEALTRLQGPAVDAALSAALHGAPPETRIVVARALGARGAIDEAPVLRRLTAGEDEPSGVRTAASLALAQLAERRGDDPGEALRAAMAVAGSADERRDVLAALDERRSPALAPLAMAWLGDAEVGREAAAVAIRSARQAPADERDAAIDTVTRASAAYPGDEKLREQAGEAIAWLERTEGYITVWAISGPWLEEGQDGAALFSITFPPETGDGGAEGWRSVAPEEIVEPGIVDFARAFGGGDRVAYALTVIHAPAAMPARLEMGSDDGVKVWLDGELVHAKDVMRGLSLGEDVVPITLREGPNRLLIKVNQGGGDWRVCCRVRSAEGLRVEGLRFEAP